jgi:phosphopentomutase
MRSILLVIDSFGIGALPDANLYGDTGSNTALHICQAIPGDKWPVLRSLGLGNAGKLLGFELPGCGPVDNPLALYGVMEEKSPGKDTTTGHWEMAGLVLDKPFHVFPSAYPSFPDTLVKDFLRLAGCGGILGNKAASGTDIIAELGDTHLTTGFPICYTSADSVFQIAAHTDKIPLDELYRYCETARKLCDPLQVGRVIARPFNGESGHFARTSDRHDYSIALPGRTLLDELSDSEVETIGIGKIGSIFNEQGLMRSHHDAGNKACLERTRLVLSEKGSKDRFVFVNLVDTDMIYGHRRDIPGYFRAVSEVDTAIGLFMESLEPGDELIITGDHGCDPGFKGTDHTREHVPALIFGKGKPGGSWGIRKSFADLATHIKSSFGLND